MKIENAMIVDSLWEEYERDEEEIEFDNRCYWDHVDAQIDDNLGK